MTVNLDGPAPCRFCGGAFDWSSKVNDDGTTTWSGVCKCGCLWEMTGERERITWRGYTAHDECMRALIVELERVRAERDEACVELVRERGDTVAWLFRNRYDDTAERIERGEHRRKEK